MPALPTGPQIAMTTGVELPGLVVEENLGLCFGLVVRSLGALRNFTAGVSTVFGGEVTEYTELLEDSRRHAVDRMVENARLLGANGIIAVRFDSTEVRQQLTEIIAYGTAVVAGAPGRR